MVLYWEGKIPAVNDKIASCASSGTMTSTSAATQGGSLSVMTCVCTSAPSNGAHVHIGRFDLDLTVLTLKMCYN